MDKKREEPEKEYDEGTTKLEQYQRRGQRLENRIKYCQQGNYKRQNQPSYPPGTGRILIFSKFPHSVLDKPSEKEEFPKRNRLYSAKI